MKQLLRLPRVRLRLACHLIFTCAVIHVKEKTIKHGVQFRHERKGCVNYRDYSGCILRY